jgi:branched-chain amino acid transport system permease protein
LSDAIVQALILALLSAGLLASVTVGLTLQAGITRIVNFAHGDFIMIGAYATYFAYTNYGINIFVAVLLGGVSVAFLSWVTYKLVLMRVLQHAQHDQLLATLGMQIILMNLALIFFTPTPRLMHGVEILPALVFGDVHVPGNNVFAAIVGFALYGGLYWFVERSRWGIPLRFAASDPELAAYAGVNVQGMFTMSFVIGGICAGIGGGLVAIVLAIQPAIGIQFVIRAFAVMVLGGMGSIPGALIGAIVFATVDGLSSVLLPNGASWGFGVSFLVLLAVMAFKPTGLLNRREA